METRETFQGRDESLVGGGEPFRDTLTVHRRALSGMVMPALVYFGMAGLAVSWMFSDHRLTESPAGTFILFFVGYPLFTWSKLRGKLDGGVLANVVADARGIFVNGTLITSRIVAGELVRSSTGNRVRLMGRFKISVLELQMNEEEKASRLLAALWLDESLARFTVLSPLRGPVLARARILDLALVTSSVVAGLLVVTCVRGLYFGPFFFGFLAALAALVLYVWPSRAMVGTDGILVRWLLSRRFIPYSSLSAIDYEETAVRLFRNDGSVIFLRTESTATGALRPLFARARAAFNEWTFGGKGGAAAR